LSDLQLTTLVNPVGPNFPPPAPGVQNFFGEGTNDLQIGTNNDFVLVSGLDETTQDVQKILLTEQGSNISFPLYGTTLQGLIGAKINPATISGTVQDQITTALQILFSLTLHLLSGFCSLQVMERILRIHLPLLRSCQKVWIY